MPAENPDPGRLRLRDDGMGFGDNVRELLVGDHHRVARERDEVLGHAPVT